MLGLLDEHRSVKRRPATAARAAAVETARADDPPVLRQPERDMVDIQAGVRREGSDQPATNPGTARATRRSSHAKAEQLPMSSAANSRIARPLSPDTNLGDQVDRHVDRDRWLMKEMQGGDVESCREVDARRRRGDDHSGHERGTSARLVTVMRQAGGNGEIPGGFAEAIAELPFASRVADGSTRQIRWVRSRG